MTTASVRYIANGFTVNWQGSQAIGVPASLYAAQLPEAVYWLGRIFDPVAQPPPPAAQQTSSASADLKKRRDYLDQLQKRLESPSAAPTIIESDDVLLGQEAQVTDIASGGFLVRQSANPGTPSVNTMRIVETYCVDMDAVHGQLNLIFTPPAS